MDIPVRIVIDAINNAGKNITGAADQLKQFGTVAIEAGAGLSAVGGITALVTKSLIEQAGAFEQNTIAFETMLGSVEKAKKLLNDIKEFAKATPFNLEELVDGSKKLLAYNVSAEQIIPTLDSLGNIAAGVGKEKLPQLILAFGQVKAATKLTGAELRQFSEAGVPLLQALVDQANATGGAMVKVGGSSKKAKVDVGELNDKLKIASQRLKEAQGNAKTKESTLMSLKNTVQNYEQSLAKANATGAAASTGYVKQKVTAEDMIGMISDGKVKFEDVQKAISGMTKEGGKFNDLMQKQAGSTLGKWSNLQDAFQQMQVTIGKSLLPAANQLLDAIIPLVDTFSAWAQANPELIKNLLVVGLVMGGIGATLLTVGLVIPPVIASFTLLGSIIGGFISIIGGVGSVVGGVVAILGGPLTIIIATLVALVGGLALAWRNNWFDIQGKTKAAGQFIGSSVQTILASLTSLWNYVQSLPTVFNQFVEQLKRSVYVFFTDTLPYAVGFFAGRLVRFVNEDAPAFINGVVNWFSQLPTRLGAILNSTRDWIVNSFNTFRNNAVSTTGNLVSSVVQQFGSMKDGINNWLSQLPGTVSNWFNQAKNNAINIAHDMYNGVREWIQGVLNFFGDIIGRANEAINKTKQAATSGFNTGKRAFGGPVNSMNSVLVGERGPEMFTPQTAGSITPAHETGGSGSGSGGVSIVVDLGTLINTQTERRNFALQIWDEINNVARSQNKTPQELLGII